jgi:3-isopropylmalate/(R)-2-methylmalate dehydratase small subunit
MKPFTVLTAVAVPLRVDKIDTGMILPGRFMRQHRRPGHDYANAFLHDLRFDEKETPRPEFPLNDESYRGAEIMVVGTDFGCGSSREGAAYAVLDYGLRALVASNFGEIFAANCLQNGILPVYLPQRIIEDIWRQLESASGSQITIDLTAQILKAPDSSVHSFEINKTRKERLVRGLDDVDVTLQYVEQISNYENERRKPWLVGDNAVRRAVEGLPDKS